MSDFVLVDPQGWEYDLHSVYSAWIGHFQVQNIPWYERTWGHVFSSFSEFLEFEWPVIVVTDARSGKAHVVTRFSAIEAFLKMIKTRFGEILHHPPNLVTVTPFETTSRPLRRVNDQSSYAKVHNSLPAAAFSAFKAKVREGDPKAVEEVWRRRDKTFLALDFEWSERNEKSVLEWGYAAVRCGFLDTQGRWPPEPDLNYRKGHFVIADYIDKVINKFCPNHPWDYAFGDSQIISKSHLSKTLGAVFTSLASPDSDIQANELVLVGHGIAGDVKRLEELKIKIPRNMLIIDTALYERRLFQMGNRGPMSLPDPKVKNSIKPRSPNSTLSLEALLRSLPTTYTPSPNAVSSGSPTSPTSPTGHNGLPRGQRITSLPGCVMHNAGNDAFMTLFALQKLLELDHTPMPTVKKRVGGRPNGHHQPHNYNHHHHSQHPYPSPGYPYAYPNGAQPYLQPNAFPPGMGFPVAIPIAVPAMLGNNPSLSAPALSMSMQRMSRSLPLVPPGQGMISPQGPPATTPSPSHSPIVNPRSTPSPVAQDSRPRSGSANRASPTDSSADTGKGGRASAGLPFPGSMKKSESRSRSPSMNMLGYTPGLGRVGEVNISEMGVLRGGNDAGTHSSHTRRPTMHGRSQSSGVLVPAVKVSDEGEGIGGSLSKAKGLESQGRSRVMSSAGLMRVEGANGNGHAKEGSNGGSGRSTPAALVMEGGRRLSAMFR